MAIKMRSGLYLRLDRLGLFANELQLSHKYGFSIEKLWEFNMDFKFIFSY